MEAVDELTVAVVVPTHGRPLRLRWLLNALEEQDESGFELVVAHNASDAPTAAVLAAHALRPRARSAGTVL